mmetsp:Transcript_37581/g.87871  ORF Transcript_37581/g.87871 Transcript_37581/m.87871 type:complete len:310 (-) Transcript_37581:279-1208(-)
MQVHEFMQPVPARLAACAAPRALLLLVLCCWACTTHADDFTVQFTVAFDEKHTGDILVTVREAKAPIGAKRFRELVNSRFFDGCAFHRVVPGFLAQFGISPNTTLQRLWDRRGPLPDETNIEHPDWNMRGTLAFATTGAGTRATQLIFNYDDNHILDSKGFVPFGRIVRGMPKLGYIYSGYRERPQASEIRRRGSAYLLSEFPRLSIIIEAKQVAFVEEPLVLSKNFTGLLITVGMVFAVVLCCAAARLLQRKLGILQQVKGYKKTSSHQLYEPEDEEADGDDSVSITSRTPIDPTYTAKSKLGCEIDD